MPRSLLFSASLLFISFAAASSLGCSTRVQLGAVGSSCDDDNQCDKARSLVCRCVRRKNPDEEGPDQILAHGVCQTSAFRCGGDGGVADTGDGAPGDTSSDGAAVDTSDGAAVDTSDGAAVDTSSDTMPDGAQDSAQDTIDDAG